MVLMVVWGSRCKSIFINQQYFFRIIFWIWPPEPQTMMNSRHFSENTSPVLRKNCYLPGFFPRVSLVGRSSRLSTHTHRHTDTTSQFDRLSCENLSENSNFVFPKLPTWGYSKIVFSMHLFFSRRRRGRCRRGRTSPGLRSGGRKTRSVEAESILRQATFFPAGKAAAERFVSKSKSDGKISEMQEKNDEIWMKYIYMVILSIHVRFQGSTFCAPRKQYMRNINL